MSTRKLKVLVASKLMLSTTVLSSLVVIAVALVLLQKSTLILSTHSLSELLLSGSWHPWKNEFGFYPFIVGILSVTGLAMAISTAPSLLMSIYLAEYAPTRLRGIIKPMVDLVAGVPSVLYGLWAFLFIMPLIRDQVAALAGVTTTGCTVLVGSMARIEFLDFDANWNQRLLCVTHSDRITELERCNLNFLEKRYCSADRLPPKIPFESLTPISEHQPYNGTVTVWEFVEGDFSRPRLVCLLRPEYKPQHAIWYQQRLWVLGVDRLEVYHFVGRGPQRALSLLKVVNDPWLSGTHTVFPNRKGHLLVTCSASDSILFVDEATLEVAKALRLPESIYGYNYNLSRADSVVDHYIVNDLQLTHLNCAYPWRGGLVVSTLIGAIGWFDSRQEYKELVRGYVGCHGVRTMNGTDDLYFCDSCLGTIVFLDQDCGIKQRIATGSVWLHDAQQITDSIFAASVTDRNQVELVDTVSRKVLAAIPGRDFG